MKSLARYVGNTETILQRVIAGELQPWKRSTAPVLNGEPWNELRRVTNLESLRRSGAFFTSGRLARTAIQLPSRTNLPSAGLIGFDPACGTGDLLLIIARHLSQRETLTETLDYWSGHLAGLDKFPQFIRLAKIRLALLALHLGAKPTVRKSFDLSRYFPEIKCGDGLKASNEFRRANFIALNPPFFLTKASHDCTWATGRITAAAQFMEHAVLNAREGTHLVGILPEVLRTGTSYGRWRALVEQHTQKGDVRHLGLFDNRADVHVFVLSATRMKPKKPKAIDWWRQTNRPHQTVSDLFQVHVGPVVPHRHRRVGPTLPYVHARSATAWKRIDELEETRKFRGTTFRGPFVVIRRTSRPEDRHRAVGTLIGTREEVAVENHLIICTPTSGTIADCKKLLAELRKPETNKFLNERIRCRHLTVASVGEIPIRAF
jgi:hypothetical protein